MKLVLDASTQIIVQQLLEKLPHASLLSGPLGVGLYTIARHVALKHTPTIIMIHPENGAISIEVIRNLYGQLRTRPAQEVVVIIDDAEKMTVEAQNAFLKLLEEPGMGISFIMTSHTPARLLPTILSRLQIIQLRRPSAMADADVQELLGESINPVKKAQIIFMAAQLPAEMKRLASDEAYFLQKSSLMRQARDFIEASRYEKLLLIQRCGTDRVQAMRFIEAIILLLRHSLIKNPQPQLIGLLQQAVIIEEKIHENGHVRSQFLRILFSS